MLVQNTAASVLNPGSLLRDHVRKIRTSPVLGRTVDPFPDHSRGPPRTRSNEEGGDILAELSR